MLEIIEFEAQIIFLSSQGWRFFVLEMLELVKIFQKLKNEKQNEFCIY